MNSSIFIVAFNFLVRYITNENDLRPVITSHLLDVMVILSLIYLVLVCVCMYQYSSLMPSVFAFVSFLFKSQCHHYIPVIYSSGNSRQIEEVCRLILESSVVQIVFSFDCTFSLYDFK